MDDLDHNLTLDPFGLFPLQEALPLGCRQGSEVSASHPALCRRVRYGYPVSIAAAISTSQSGTDLSESLTFVDCNLFRFGVGILHSMEKATQFVQGTPKLAASHRT